MGSNGSDGAEKSTGNKWPLGLLIVLVVLAIILAVWLFVGWMITKTLLGAVYLILKVFTAPFSK